MNRRHDLNGIITSGKNRLKDVHIGDVTRTFKLCTSKKLSLGTSRGTINRRHDLNDIITSGENRLKDVHIGDVTRTLKLSTSKKLSLGTPRGTINRRYKAECFGSLLVQQGCNPCSRKRTEKQKTNVSVVCYDIDRLVTLAQKRTKPTNNGTAELIGK